jgi:hypothetical protein
VPREGRRSSVEAELNEATARIAELEEEVERLRQDADIE